MVRSNQAVEQKKNEYGSPQLFSLVTLWVNFKIIWSHNDSIYFKSNKANVDKY